MKTESYLHVNNRTPSGSKEKAPLHPVKEIKPDIYSLGLTAGGCAHVRTRDPQRRRCIAAALKDALQIFGGTRGPAPSDETLWANFIWRKGCDCFLDAVAQARAEMAEHASEVPWCERPKILQSVLNTRWNKQGGAR